MTPNIDAGRARDDLAVATSDMLCTLSPDQRKAVLAWIDARTAFVQCQMVDCQHDKLAGLQTRLATLIEMQKDLLPTKSLPQSRLMV